MVHHFMPEPEYLFDVCLLFAGLLYILTSPVLSFLAFLLPFDLPFLPSTNFTSHFFLDIFGLKIYPHSALISPLPMSLFHFSVFSQPSSPDYMLGPSKNDRAVPSTG